MWFSLLLLVPILAGGGFYFFLSARSRKRSSAESEANLPYTDAAFQWFGIDKGCVVLKRGGAAVLLEISGFDYDTADDSQVAALNTALAEAMRSVTAVSGYGANAGVSINLCAQLGKSDLSDLLENIQRAEDNTTEPGLAGQALLDRLYLKQRADQHPFAQRRYYVVISLTAQAMRQELLAAEEEAEVARVWQEKMEALARQDIEAANNFEEYQPKESFREKMLENLKDGWQELFGTASRVQIGGGITAHPIPAILAQTLRHKAETFLAACQEHGMHGRILTSRQAAEALAHMLYLPTRPSGDYEWEINRETTRLQAVIDLVRNSKLSGEALEKAVQEKLEALDERDRRDRRNTSGSGEVISLFEPRNGQEDGPVDIAAFGSVPVEFEGSYVRLGMSPGVEAAQARLVAAIQTFRSLPTKPLAAARHLESVLAANGRRQSWPRPHFMTSLYTLDWPRQVPMGALYPLIAKAGLEVVINVQIKAIPKRKAQKKLDKARYGIEMSADVDKDRRRIYERSFKVEAIDDLQSQLASDEGIINMVGLRITVRADNPLQLRRDTRQVISLLQGVGLTVAEARFNQALALHSVLPLGLDYLGETFLVGNRTMRNMTAETTACFFPALLPDKAAQGGILIGHDESGSLVRLSEKNLVNPHEIICGMSGSGKTVSELIELRRRLYENPKLRVRYIDPQDVTSRLVKEVDGVVANVAANGSVRFNFLDRFSLGGRPQIFGDLCDVFTTMVVLMQKRSLSDAEHTALKTQLNVLFQHFEQGDSLTAYLMKSLYLRFADKLGFVEEPQSFFRFEQAVEEIYRVVSEEYRVPASGFVVRLKLNEATGEVETRTYQTRQADGSIVESEPGVVLEVLNCYTEARFKRNLYAGGGYSEIEIPVAAFLTIYSTVMEQGWGQIENEAWLAYSLTNYLSGPFPRRAAGSAGWSYPDVEAEARRVSGLPGTHLQIESGPVWYADDEWYARLLQAFQRHLARTGLLDYLDRYTREIVERDLMVGLRYGTPILSDVIPLLAAEPAGLAMALNLEPYCNPNIHGSLFNGHTNLDISSRFFSFNVKGLTDQLRPLRMMQCIELTWREIAGTPRNAGLEFVVVWDEYGTIATQSPEVATYIGIIFKRARALGGKIIVAEQNYETFLSPSGRHVLANAGVIKLLRQNTYAAKFWAGELELTIQEANRLTLAHKGETLVVQMEDGRKNKLWVQYGAHKRTLDMLSTKPQDVQRYEAEQRAGQNLSPVAEMMANLIEQV
ncbi:MAG TPA: hypothetical protein VH186_15675 [Chloroflexia bacterium]|nr:hypothetical protein [Chloroflexia bacterium]